MLEVAIDQQMIRFGKRMGVSFHRTLRIPEDLQAYPLPPGLGRFPVYTASEYADRLPKRWQISDGGFIPMYQREALWIGFNGTSWKPNAVVVAVGGVNAVSGESLGAPLCAEPQNYIVAPPQPWLDGINSADGIIRQFVAMPLGAGRTIEAAVSGKETIGGIQVVVYEPKPDRFPETEPTDQPAPLGEDDIVRPMRAPVQPMGIGAGGKMRQKIYRDPYGVDTWDQTNYGKSTLYIVNSRQFKQITGQNPPPSPVSAKQYSEHGLPWFELYDESMAGIAPSELLSRVHEADRPASQTDTTAEEESVEISSGQIETIGRNKSTEPMNSS